MIRERVVLDITPGQAALVLAALRAELGRADRALDPADAQRIRAVIAAIKDAGIV